MLVESLSIFIGQLDMLELIDAYGYMTGPVNEDIDRHQDGVSIQTHTTIIVAFLFVLDHRVEPMLRTDAAEYPRQLCMMWDLRLNKQTHLLLIDSA